MASINSVFHILLSFNKNPITPNGKVLPLLFRVPIINSLKKFIVRPPEVLNLALASNVSAPKSNLNANARLSGSVIISASSLENSYF